VDELRARVFIALTFLAVAGLASEAVARPENIRAGESYYSDDHRLVEGVRDIIGEKNFEEVYQFYAYYEAVYDEQERVIVFKEYKRGEVIALEKYRYGTDGKLAERVVQRPGEPPEVTRGDSIQGKTTTR